MTHHNMLPNVEYCLGAEAWTRVCETQRSAPHLFNGQAPQARPTRCPGSPAVAGMDDSLHPCVKPPAIAFRPSNRTWSFLDVASASARQRLRPSQDVDAVCAGPL